MEIGGPEVFGLDKFIAMGLAAHHDPREVVSDRRRPVLRTLLAGRELVLDDGAQRGATSFDDWPEVDVLSAPSPDAASSQLGATTAPTGQFPPGPLRV